MDRPDFSRLQKLGRVSLGLAEEFRRHWLRVRLPGLSAEIAFYALLGLFPAVIVFAGALGSLDAIIGAGAAADIEGWLLERVTETFRADTTLQRTVADLFDRSNAGVITLGAVLTLYASSRGFIAVVRALDVTYGHEHRRRWLSTRVAGFTITIVTVVVAALVAVMVVVGPLLGSGEEVAERVGRGSGFATAWVWFRWPVVFVVVVVWAACVYHFAPHRQSSLRSELPGAIVATVWWLAVSTGFRVYLGLASGRHEHGVRSAGRRAEPAVLALPAVDGPPRGRRHQQPPRPSPAEPVCRRRAPRPHAQLRSAIRGRQRVARPPRSAGEHRLGGERHAPLQGLVHGAAAGNVDEPGTLFPRRSRPR